MFYGKTERWKRLKKFKAVGGDGAVAVVVLDLSCNEVWPEALDEGMLLPLVQNKLRQTVFVHGLAGLVIEEALPTSLALMILNVRNSDWCVLRLD